MSEEKKDLSFLPFSKGQQQNLEELLEGLTPEQQIWLSGYFTGMVKSKMVNGRPKNKFGTDLFPVTGSRVEPDLQGIAQAEKHLSEGQATVAPKVLTILYGSRSGNSQWVAEEAAKYASGMGFKVKCEDMADYKQKKLGDEKNILIVVSTHGEGDPPVPAEEFYDFVHGAKAPKLKGVNFSVCALGDSSYVHYCKIGVDFDKRFEELGGSRFYHRVDCDLDFEDPASEWYKEAINTLNGILSEADARVKTEPKTGLAPSESVKSSYNRKNPFKARIIDKVKLNGRGSAKETYHIELSLEGSGLQYQAGDAIGIYPTNSPKLVSRVLSAVRLNPDSQVKVGDIVITLEEALTNYFELTLLTRDFIQKYNQYANKKELGKLLENPEELKNFIYGRQVSDFIRTYPAAMGPQEFVNILRKLPPRLYSIASSLDAYPGEAHILVCTVRYNYNGVDKEGVCSTFLADRASIEETVPVYIDKNPVFRLPGDAGKPVIMVGPGTGIAPFRAFLQHIEEQELETPTWLFFGDQHFTTDFYYQTEWQKLLKKGVLNKMDVAFSRDQKQKVYVQHKLLENACEVFNWLENGAYVYICGDADRMAGDVQQAFLKIISEKGGLTSDKAEEYFKNLIKSKRYIEDVY